MVGTLKAGWAALRPWPARLGRHLRRGAVPYGVLVVALTLTLLAYYYVRQNVEVEERARFKDATQAVKTVIYRRVSRYLDAMLGARGLFSGGPPVDRDQWVGYVRALEPQAGFRLDGFQSLGFAKYVRPEEVDAFSREARRNGGRGLWPEPDKGRESYFPMQFVAPSNEANRNMIGYDAYADPEHRVVMQKARDTDTPQATRVDYVLTQAPPGSESDLVLAKALVVYLPVYAENEPVKTVDQRRRALRGFIVATFTTEELFGEAYGKAFDPAVDLEVYDGEKETSRSLLYDKDGVRSAGEDRGEALFSRERRIERAGREWVLYFATLPAFERGARSNLPVFVLASGIMVSILLFGIALMLARSRTRAYRAGADLGEANRELERANAELQRSRESLISAREEERRRLRRDLHDGVGPQLAALMLELETAGDLVSENPEASALMAKLSRRAGEIVSDVRRSVHALRPPALDELGLVGALEEGAVQYGPAGLRISVEEPEELSRLPAAVEVACYRIVQEALTNVVRHAGASNCSIRIRPDEEASVLVVEVQDDGRGIRDHDRTGVGLISMRERTEELGGRCTVRRLGGGGTLVTAFLPFQAENAVPPKRNEGA